MQNHTFWGLRGGGSTIGEGDIINTFGHTFPPERAKKGGGAKGGGGRGRAAGKY